MKSLSIVSNCVWMLFAFVPSAMLLAQRYGGPLTVHGLNQTTLSSAAARAIGGSSFSIQNELTSMFRNPATLHSLTGPQLSIGGIQKSVQMEQVQHYAPVRYYSNLSLLLEGRTGGIPDPNPIYGGSTSADTVQRPFDTIGPNWTRTENRSLPLQAMVALPLARAGVRIAAGAGVVEYANVDYYYQNNNVLTPPVLSQRPLPVFRPTNDAPLHVYWSQDIRSREGSIYGYGVALAAELPGTRMAVGVSGLLLRGTSDDFEQRIGRGRLTFFANSFRLDSVAHRVVQRGTSDYRGEEFTLSSLYRGQYVTIGVSAQLPSTITREFTLSLQQDTAGVSSTREIHGEDQLRLPWRWNVALVLTPRENLRLAFNYDLRSYANAVVTSANGSESSPWLSSSMLGVGAEYEALPWLKIRGGMRGEAQVFEAEGNPLAGEPVTTMIYSLGFGVRSTSVRLNVAYEYSNLKYQDVWGSAVSLNSSTRHFITADLVYELPELW